MADPITDFFEMLFTYFESLMGVRLWLVFLIPIILFVINLLVAIYVYRDCKMKRIPGALGAALVVFFLTGIWGALQHWLETNTMKKYAS